MCWMRVRGRYSTTSRRFIFYFNLFINPKMDCCFTGFCCFVWGSNAPSLPNSVPLSYSPSKYKSPFILYSFPCPCRNPLLNSPSKYKSPLLRYSFPCPCRSFPSNSPWDHSFFIHTLNVAWFPIVPCTLVFEFRFM